MIHKDNKNKGMSRKEIERQMKYDAYENGHNASALQKFKQRPYQLEYVDGGKNHDDRR